MNILVTLLLVIIWTSSAAAAEISARQIQPGKYEFALSSPTVLSESEAMAQIATAAAATCKSVTPVLGKYRYEANEVIGATNFVSQRRDTFRFVQEVSCVPGARVQTDERRPTLRDEEESRLVQNEVKLKSETYFRLIANKRVDEAITQVALEGMGVNDVSWKSGKLSFQAIAGEPVEISISKITVYDNPEGSPKPGLYVAADFSNVYHDVPIHCGYLMWFRPIGGEFRITREETGHVTAEQLKAIPTAQVPEIKQRLRCLAP